MGQLKGIQINNVKAVHWKTGQMVRNQINNGKEDLWEAANCADTVCIEWHLAQLKHGCALVAAKVLSSLGI